MVGAYSDNQPDYSWLQPYESREWTQYWYPFRGIDGVKNANLDAAVNLEVKNGKAAVGFFSTEERPSATVTLKLKDRVLLNEKIAIGPGHPYAKEIALPSGADEHDLRAAMAANGKELAAYSPVRLEKETMPSPVENPPAPAEIKTNEELYLTGLRMEQFHSPSGDPNAYWQEALRRDPADIRVNTVLGIDAIKGGRYADAEKLLRTALERATASYTSPKEGEAFYYLGLALKAQGKLDDAYTQFYKSTWSSGWRSAGYFEAAEILSAKGDFNEALTKDEDALEANALNVRALALKAALLRHLGRANEALAAVAAIQKIDPLDVQGIAEQWMAAKSPASAAQLQTTMNAHPATALEAAGDYMDAGLWQDGTTLLTQVAGAAADKAKVSPLVYYYLGYFAGKLNQAGKAAEQDRLAEKAPAEYVFPFQMEMIAVLEDAMRINPSDARAPYYLGNLLFDWQPQRAQALWEKSVSLGADFPVVYRNLAMVYTRQGDQREKAQAALEKALQFGGNATVIGELDKLYEENGVPPAKRLAVMEAHQAVINRDEAIAREVNLEIFAGKPDAAIQLLRTRFFRAWEGGGRFSLGDSWINANLERGHREMTGKRYAEALASYQAALRIPANLQEAAGNVSSRKSEVSYWIGNAYEAMGEKEKARSCWSEATKPPVSEAPEPRGPFRERASMGGQAAGGHVEQAALYYQAVAMEKLGQAEQARAIFEQLIDTGTKSLGGVDGKEASGQRTKAADAHYLAGLGQLGLKRRDQARREFSLALEAVPDHYAAMRAITEMGP
jgi:tetratricopeptide (TPR) repeat protein